MWKPAGGKSKTNQARPTAQDGSIGERPESVREPSQFDFEFDFDCEYLYLAILSSSTTDQSQARAHAVWPNVREEEHGT